MTPERWEQVGEIYHAALELTPSEWVPFLSHACGGDEELRREVQSLLAAHEQAGSLIAAPALEVVAKAVAQEQNGTQAMPTQPLTDLMQDCATPERMIGRFRIISLLGRGGMGEVYLAEDSRLGRKVAIKLLPAEFTQDEDRVGRFEQEARAASALNHPNIIIIFEIGEAEGVHYIATEYVAGQTLRQLMASEKMNFGDALAVATQVANALAEAHKAGILHRDIKPENLMVRPDGVVKVLDFGLAKLIDRRPEFASDAGVSTASGMVMGTARYMSPEQARGQEVDARTDIFSLGVVLYEMLAGKAPFAGATMAEVIAAILHVNPPFLSALRPETPQELERVVMKALRKQREERYQTAGEFLFILADVKYHLSASGITNLKKLPSAKDPAIFTEYRQATATLANKARHNKAVLMVIALFLLAIPSYFVFKPPRSVPKVLGVTPITTDGRLKANITMNHLSNTLVTDGPRVYFTGLAGGSLSLIQVSGVGGEAMVIPTTVPRPFVLDSSPNRAELLVASFTAYEHETSIWAVPLPGGTPRRIGNILAHAAAWSPDGRRIAYANGTDLFLASNDGSDSRKLDTLTGKPQWLRWSPDGGRLRFTIQDPLARNYSLWEIEVDGSNLHPLLPGWNTPSNECCGSWMADGKFFLFQSTRNQTTSIWALAEETEGIRKAKPEPVQLTFGPMNYYQPAPSSDGRRIFVIGEQQRGELVRFDAKTRLFGNYFSGMSAYGLSFSKDRQWIAYISHPEGSLWRSRLDGSARRQLTLPPIRAEAPRWSPDGEKIVFTAMTPGKPWKIHLISAGGGIPEQLMSEERREIVSNWSLDGSRLFFDVRGGIPAKRSIHLLDLKTRRVSDMPIPPEGAYGPRLSPDGRYLVAVQSASPPILIIYDFQTRQWSELIKLNSGSHEWSRDGKYVYFLNIHQENEAICRVRIEDRQVERLASLKEIRLASLPFVRWMGLAPDDSPLVLRDAGSQDVYAIELQIP